MQFNPEIDLPPKRSNIYSIDVLLCIDKGFPEHNLPIYIYEVGFYDYGRGWYMVYERNNHIVYRVIPLAWWYIPEYKPGI